MVQNDRFGEVLSVKVAWRERPHELLLELGLRLSERGDHGVALGVEVIVSVSPLH